MNTPESHSPATNDIPATLRSLELRFGEAFAVTAAQITDYRNKPEPGQPAADTCVTCDVPKDTCTSCDASDVTCNNQHDIVCVTCDEGDVCTKNDGSCNLMGDIPCGQNDK